MSRLPERKGIARQPVPLLIIIFTKRKLCIFGIMDTPTKPTNTHIGRKISRIRELRGIKQETLASELGVSQQSVSRMEQSEVLEDDVLEKVAKILGVQPDAIKNFSEEAVFNYFNKKLLCLNACCWLKEKRTNF
jgi:DNA-binding XRE family transcriptional regulator